jgi:hypothetical protein
LKQFKEPGFIVQPLSNKTIISRNQMIQARTWLPQIEHKGGWWEKKKMDTGKQAGALNQGDGVHAVPTSQLNR